MNSEIGSSNPRVTECIMIELQDFRNEFLRNAKSESTLFPLRKVKSFSNEHEGTVSRYDLSILSKGRDFLQGDISSSIGIRLVCGS